MRRKPNGLITIGDERIVYFKSQSEQQEIAGAVIILGSSYKPGEILGVIIFFSGILIISYSFLVGIGCFLIGSLMLVLSYKSSSLSSESHIQSANSYEYTPTSSNQELTPYQIKLEKANQMRQNPTQAERRMWEILTSVMQNFPEYTFDTQSVQYGYILDFFCPTLNLAIEVDGSSHANRRGADWERDMNLKRRGIEILRVNNEEVFDNPQGLANSLCKIIQEIDPSVRERNFSKIEEDQFYREPYQPRRYKRRSYQPRRY